MTSLLQTLVPRKLRIGLYRSAVRIRHFGFQRTCPFCNARLGRFLSHGKDTPLARQLGIVGAGRREEGRCPVCGSHDRERLVYLFLLHETTLLRSPHRLLHVAPEIALEERLRGRPHLEYTTIGLKAECVMQCMDVTELAFADNTFDAVVCNHVLEHVDDDRKALGELFRVLKPGGWAVLQVPLAERLDATREDPAVTDPEERERYFGQWDHVRLYGQDYPDRLRDAGFTVQLFQWTEEGRTFGGPANRYGLNPREVIHLASKPR